MAKWLADLVALALGILGSGRGTTAAAVLAALAEGHIKGSARLVVYNNAGAGIADVAARAGVPAVRLSGITHPDPLQLDEAITAALLEAEVTHVLLAGYMKKLGRKTLEAYRGRVINTHPALLPKHGGQGMYGEHVHRAVLAAGDTETGATVHLVDGEYDHGEVLRQARVPVQPDDDVATLGARVQAAEKRLLVEVLADLASVTP